MGRSTHLSIPPPPFRRSKLPHNALCKTTSRTHRRKNGKNFHSPPQRRLLRMAEEPHITVTHSTL